LALVDFTLSGLFKVEVKWFGISKYRIWERKLRRVGWREERREFDTHLKANPPIE